VLKNLLTHPRTLRARRIVRRVVATCAVCVAVALVVVALVDLGPHFGLRELAERQGSRFLERPLRIGRLGVHLWEGRFEIEDVVIEGLTPQSPPFLRAKSITIQLRWSPLLRRRVVLDSVEMADWRMVVELMADGRNSFPRLPSRPRGPRRWSTIFEYVHTYNGEFEYLDHDARWSVVARNLNVAVGRPQGVYRGRASLSKSTVTIQDFVPFGADMVALFSIDDGRAVFDRIDLVTDGARTVLTGDTNFSYWPEQMYRVRSEIDLSRMREIFFAKDRFALAGTGRFDGTFHLFRETLSGGRTRTGRELKGTLESRAAGINAYRVADLRTDVRWTRDALEVTDSRAGFHGGEVRVDYRIAPLGRRDAPSTHRLDVAYDGVDLTSFTGFLELEGIRLAGRASGRHLMEWPGGRFPARAGRGALRVEPPAGVVLMTRRLPAGRVDAGRDPAVPAGPFSPHTPQAPVAVGGELEYAFDAEWIDIAPSRVASESTYVEFEGRTAFGDDSTMSFHVSSGDWQDSDRILAGILTAFGSPTRAVPIDGFGTFDGVMRNSFRRPRIEGTFEGRQMKAWDVEWGEARGTAVIENGYVDVAGAVIRSGESSIELDGRFAAGYPRRDGGEEIDARVRVIRRPLGDLKHAFTLDEYDVEGSFSGEFHLFGHYRTPYGYGTMAITDGVAYGERFEQATSSLRFEGSGARLDNLQIVKANARGTGAADLRWNGTYSFTFDAQNIPVESLGLVEGTGLPLSGLLDVRAGGSGAFAAPRFDVHAEVRDFFVADEGIGLVVGDVAVADQVMSLTLNAGSPRLTVQGAGRIARRPGRDADLTFTVTNTSLDPYVRAFQPGLSPFTTAVASGTVRVVGQLADVDRLLVDATVDRVELSLFDYVLRNASPIRIALDNHTMRVAEMRLEGEGTGLTLSGSASLHCTRAAEAAGCAGPDRIDVRVTGDTNLAILQALDARGNVRSSGRASLQATLTGPLREPLVSGTMTIENGRIRHFGLPHALEALNGALAFDSRAIRLDALRGEIGGGPVQFGGALGIEGYRLGRLDVTMTGRNLRLRFPEGMRSLVDATLALQGTPQAARLAGDVEVRNAVYSRPFETDLSLIDFGGAPALPEAPASGVTLPLAYDVRISAPSTLRVQNNVADLVASADLRLQGTFDRPLLFGGADVERGEVTFDGRRYVVTRGTIDLSNPARFDPFLDVEVETRVRVPGENYRVNVRLSGTFDKLVPTVSSDPPLPEGEVLALLFSDAPGRDVEFRRYSTDITPQQELAREMFARALTSTISSPVSRAAEQAFGLEVFQVTPLLADPNQQSSRLDPAARVTLGKRVSPRCFITYQRSLSSSTRDQIVVLECNQTDRLSWILSRNEDGTYALDFQVRRTLDR
jgi:hypothetical protein